MRCSVAQLPFDPGVRADDAIQLRHELDDARAVGGDRPGALLGRRVGVDGGDRSEYVHLGSRVRAGREDVRVGELEDLVEALTEAKGRQCGSAPPPPPPPPAAAEPPLLTTAPRHCCPLMAYTFFLSGVTTAVNDLILRFPICEPGGINSFARRAYS